MLTVAKSTTRRRGRPIGSKNRQAQPSEAVLARDEAFVLAYLACGFSYGAAAQRLGCPPETAIADGKVLYYRNRDRIVAAIKAQREELFLQADEVLRDMALAFRLDKRQLYNPDGSVKSMADLPDEVARFVDGHEVTEHTVTAKDGTEHTTRTTKVKLERRTALREQAMKVMGMFPREQAPLDADEQARLVRERLGDISKLQDKRRARSIEETTEREGSK